MANWITFAWQIEFVAIAIFIYGLVIFLKSIINLDRDFRLALILILSSVIINIAFGIMIGVFLSKGPGESVLAFWIIRPIATLITALLVMLGARKFFVATRKAEE